ncbi:unnamed protein product, partial [Prorocentrum cordatum]
RSVVLNSVAYSAAVAAASRCEQRARASPSADGPLQPGPANRHAPPDAVASVLCEPLACSPGSAAGGTADATRCSPAASEWNQGTTRSPSPKSSSEPRSADSMADLPELAGSMDNMEKLPELVGSPAHLERWMRSDPAQVQ